MDKKEIREQDLSAQVRREIYIMRSLSHRHIVRMYEVLTSNTKLYIVMELVTGGLLYTQCGTPDYCAPEIIERADEGYNGAKVDVWSCGIIPYVLPVGRLPFREEQTDKLYDLILACQVAYPTFISADAQNLVSRLLVRNAAHRLPLAEIKHHPWFLVDYKGDDARAL
jgi:serine/threonine protein kinase